jgi:hypothetical protein
MRTEAHVKTRKSYPLKESYTLTENTGANCRYD